MGVPPMATGPQEPGGRNQRPPPLLPPLSHPLARGGSRGLSRHSDMGALPPQFPCPVSVGSLCSWASMCTSVSTHSMEPPDSRAPSPRRAAALVGNSGYHSGSPTGRSPTPQPGTVTRRKPEQGVPGPLGRVLGWTDTRGPAQTGPGTHPLVPISSRGTQQPTARRPVQTLPQTPLQGQASPGLSTGPQEPLWETAQHLRAPRAPATTPALASPQWPPHSGRLARTGGAPPLCSAFDLPQSSVGSAPCRP